MAASVDQKLLRQTKFPPEFNQKVDMTKVNVEVMKKWIASKISEILGSEDDVVIELCFNLLEGSRFPDIKVLQIQLTGFLDKDTARFCKELWNLCLSAQANPQGVPKELLEAKKLELIQEKIDAEKAAELAWKRQEQEKARERDIDTVRQRERADRGRGRGAGRGGSFRNSRPTRGSQSPPRRRRGPPFRELQRREGDTYVPGSRAGQRDERRPRSPTRSTSRSSSSSRSPSLSPHRPKYRHRSRSLSHRRSRSQSQSSSPRKLQKGRRSISSSESPARHRHDGRRSYKDGRARSLTRSDSSRSASPRKYRRYRSRSPSRSPPRRHGAPVPRRKQPRPRSRSRHVSSSRSPRPRRGGYESRSFRSRKSPSISDDDKMRHHADIVKELPHREEHRLSRSPGSFKRRRRSSPNRSRSRSGGRRHERRRRRSLPRYEPVGRKSRNTSSSSSSDDEPPNSKTYDPDHKMRSLSPMPKSGSALNGDVKDLSSD